ncbi:MAG: hypothetical protein JJW01_01805 [Alphaproteobacteria bacterium]|nr:hypothetical protein [Rickettsiales bacterium]
MQNSNNFVNYFKMFSLPESIKIDSEYLFKKYTDLQKNSLQLSSEDLLSNDNTNVKHLSAAEINKGFTTLSNKLLCCEHFFKLNGYDIANVNLAEEFFLEILELQEVIVNNVSDKNNITLNVNGKIKTLFNDIENYIDTHKTDIAFEMFAKIKYYDKLLKLISR